MLARQSIDDISGLSFSSRPGHRHRLSGIYGHLAAGTHSGLTLIKSFASALNSYMP